MKPKIAIDVDGTIIDNIPTWVKLIHQKDEEHKHEVNWDKDYKYGYPPTWEHIYEVCGQCFNDALFTDESINAPLFPGVQASLFFLQQYADLYLVSCAPPVMSDKYEKRFKDENIFFFREGYWGVGDKAVVCNTLGISAILDDCPHQLESVHKNAPHTLPIIFTHLERQAYNSHVRVGAKVNSWMAVTELFKQIFTQMGVINVQRNIILPPGRNQIVGRP